MSTAPQRAANNPVERLVALLPWEGLRDLLREAIEARDFVRALHFFDNASNRGYLFLERALPDVPADQRARCVIDAWQGGLYGEEAPDRQDPARGRQRTEQTVALFRAVPELEGTARHLPSPLTVYRGVSAQDRPTEDSWLVRQPSWTTRRDIAAWFASRDADETRTPWMVTAEIDRVGVLAYLDERQHAEVIVDPARLVPGSVQIAPLRQDDVEGVDRIMRARHQNTLAWIESVRVKRSATP